MTAQEQAPTAGSNPVPPKPVQQPPAARPGPEDSDDEGDQGVGKVVVPGVIGVVVGMASTVITEKTTGLISGKTNTDAAAILQKVNNELPDKLQCSTVKDISTQIPKALANAKAEGEAAQGKPAVPAETSTEIATLKQENGALTEKVQQLEQAKIGKPNQQADVNLEDVKRVIRTLATQYKDAEDKDNNYGTLIEEWRAECPHDQVKARQKAFSFAGEAWIMKEFMDRGQ